MPGSFIDLQFLTASDGVEPGNFVYAKEDDIPAAVVCEPLSLHLLSWLHRYEKKPMPDLIMTTYSSMMKAINDLRVRNAVPAQFDGFAINKLL